MPRLTIDQQEISVPSGIKVIEAAELLGIMIPRFCYHPALGSVGACRVCAVKFQQGPFKGLQMSCMVDAEDGMVISTTDAEAVEFRRYVIEWLMMNHPHDCPVCDEGGHCLLQDMTISGGHGLRRYRGKKRTYPDQYLGPLVQHEMNRCIHCYRCSRFYQEFTGYRDLGVMQIASRTYFGRSAAGVLESPFTGNLSDICPTGVYTDKPSRYKGRRWDYERTPAICTNCSLGCHTVVSVRYREIVRQEARYSAAVNGHFICDRGRFGFYYAQENRRPQKARVDGQSMEPVDGLQLAATKLSALSEKWGTSAIACIGGVRSSLETQAALYRLSRIRKWQGPVFFTDSDVSGRIAAAVDRIAEVPAVTLSEVERADTIVVVGADPLNEAPMLALALRQAQRQGADVVVIDPRPVNLPCTFMHLPISPSELAWALGRLMLESVPDQVITEHSIDYFTALLDLPAFDRTLQQKLSAVAKLLDHSRRPVVVCGTDITTNQLPDLAADAVLLLKAAGKVAGVFYVMSAAGTFGAALYNEESLESILSGIENGVIRGLVSVETDLLCTYPNRNRLEQALGRLDVLVTLDCLDNDLGRRSQVLLPLATVYEAGGHFVNQDGRLQWFPPACRGGGLVSRTGGAMHPLRTYASRIPGDRPVSGWESIAILGGESAPIDPLAEFSKFIPSLPGLPAPIDVDRVSGEGWRVRPVSDNSRSFNSARVVGDSRLSGCLLVVFSEQTFGTEPLSSRAPCLAELTPAACVYLHPIDAGPLGLTDGVQAVITTGQGQLTLPVQVTDSMAEGVLIIPRHFKTKWQIWDASPAVLPRESIKPAERGDIT